MFIAEILELLNSEYIEDKLKIVNDSTYIEDIQYDEEKSFFIFLGVYFFSKTEKEFELFYNFITCKIIRQPVFILFIKFLGLICILNEKKKFINGTSSLFINEYSSDNSSLKHQYLADEFDISDFKLGQKIITRDPGDGTTKEFYDFKIYDINDENIILKKYPLLFPSFKVFYNKQKDRYEQILFED